MERIITFSAPFSGTLRDVLRRRFSARFCTFLKKEPGRIAVNSLPATGRTKVRAGDEITARFSEEKSARVSPCDLPLSVVYEDEDLLVVDKPQGVATVMTFGFEQKNLLGALYARADEYNYHVVTRLDKDTTGLVLVAKSGVAHSLLAAAPPDKIYLAEAEGIVPKPVTVVITQGRGEDVTRMVKKGGQRAVTKFRPLSYAGGNTLLAVCPKTGRTHQIRLAAKVLGHPLAGDTLYGSGEGSYNGGQHLCCYQLRFLHPVTAAVVEIRAKIPSFWGNAAPPEEL